MLALRGGVEQEVGGLLEGGQHDGGVLHLVDPVAGEADDPALAGHHLGQQVDVAGVHIHPVLLHGLGHLVDDAVPGCLDAQVLLDLQDVVGGAPLGVDPVDPQHLAQAQPLGVDYMLPIGLLGDEGSVYGVDAPDRHCHDLASYGLELVDDVGLGDWDQLDGLVVYFGDPLYLALEAALDSAHNVLGAQVYPQLLDLLLAQVQVKPTLVPSDNLAY